MTTRAGISINTSPVADAYSDRNRERRIEFSSPVGGGLISFSYTPDDQLSVHVYRQDMTVTVTAGEAGEPVQHGNLRADRALYEAARAFVASWEARNITPELIREARGWIADNAWENIGPDDVADLTDAQVITGIRRYYEGGWAAFVAASPA